MVDANLLQVQTARIDGSRGLKLKKVSCHRRVLFDHTHRIGQKEGLDSFGVIELETHQELLFNHIVFDGVQNRNNKSGFLFEESFIGGVEIS